MKKKVKKSSSKKKAAPKKVAKKSVSKTKKVMKKRAPVKKRVTKKVIPKKTLAKKRTSVKKAVKKKVAKKKVEKKVEVGTIRIRSRELDAVERTSVGWKPCELYEIEAIRAIVHKYKAHANFTELVSSSDNRFLKGERSREGVVRGERVGILPNGKKLNKAFSLFSKNLTMHDEVTNDHWDVMFQNPNGSLAHLYTVEKTKKSKQKKYAEVKEFSKRLPQLERRLERAIKNKELLALPLYTLIKTYMRVGNPHSYHSLGHKGLTTLNKKNITLGREHVTFDYIGKDGVPQTSKHSFPKIYVVHLEKHLKPLGEDDVVFTTPTGKFLRDTHLEDGFLKYTGRKFYPHIVRSHYATNRVEQFLKKHKKPTKEQVKMLYDEIAETLGHKKFSKKDNAWNTDHTITVSHYINPELVDKISKIILEG